MSTKPNQRSRIQIHLLRKNKPTSGQRKQSDSRTKSRYSQSHLGCYFRKFKVQNSKVSFTTFQWKRRSSFELWALKQYSKMSPQVGLTVSWQTSEETKRDRDMWQKRSLLEKMCRMETSFLISLTLVSNNNYWILRKLITNSGPHSHIHLHYQYTIDETTRSWSERERKRETHTHNRQRTSPSCRIITNELPRRYSVTKSGSHSHIHPHFQYTMDKTTVSWSERETHAHNQQGDSDWKKAREKEEEPRRKRMLYQSVATNFRPNSLSVQIELDITRIYAGRWDPSQSRGRERKR